MTLTSGFQTDFNKIVQVLTKLRKAWANFRKVAKVFTVLVSSHIHDFLVFLLEGVFREIKLQKKIFIKNLEKLKKILK